MSFVSYAQNCEDVMLWRALRQVGRGFYIDVGANHPSDDSVTRAFYDRGWSGINIEPLPEHVEQLRAERPRDINLAVAVGARNGEIELFEGALRGLATSSPELARHGAAGAPLKTHRVAVRRLADICAEHAAPQIHFLKIDVEGMESDVLKGMDFQRYRPWIVVVEATLPNSTELNIAWEPLLLDAGYRCAYFDGLNRYYLASEHQELQAAFATPPNVFDDYVRVEQLRLAERFEQARRQAEEARARADEFHAMAHHSRLELLELQGRIRRLEQRAADGEAHAQLLREVLRLTHLSTSWRITAPLRAAGLAWRWLRSGGRIEQPRLALVSVAQAPPRQRQGVPRFDYTALPAAPRPPETLVLARQAAAQDRRWVRITGHVEGHYSLALVNRGLALALDRRAPGSVQFVPCHHEPYANPADLPRAQQGRLRAMIARRLPDDAEILSIVHHYPLVTDAQQAARRLAIFFWEESAVPAETIRRINDSFDAVLVASRFVKRALINSGCRLPVLVIPLGVDQVLDLALVHPSPLGRLKHRAAAWLAQFAARASDDAACAPVIEDLRPAGTARFRFLHISSAFERKGVDLLLEAYFAQFTSADPVELYIKTFPNPHNSVRALLDKLQAGRANAPGVIVDESSLDELALAKLYRSAQAMVLPTRGEGFNLPAAEAMALGVPVITTGQGAHADFCTQESATLLPFHFAASASHLKSPDACWIEPDAGVLGAQMRRMFGRVMDRDPALETQRRRAAQYVRSVYRWRNGATAVLGAAKWLDQRPSADTLARPRLALLSPWATRCGVAEYAMGLLGALCAARSCDIDVYCETRTSEAAAAAQRDVACMPRWSIGDGASVESALHDIGQGRYDMLVLQHQPSLFQLDDAICASLDRIKRQGCCVLVELHSTQQLLFAHRLTAASIAVLRGLDRIVVHQVEDLNNLLALGLSENLMLLPLGVQAPLPDLPELAPARVRQELGIAPGELVIGAFGFLFPHKGIDTLVHSIAPLAAASGRPVRLLCVNSTPDAQSAQTLRQYQALAKELAVEARITWLTDYLPIGECLRLLGAADYIVCPYKDTRESASAAVMIGLAARKPVLVSPLHIFADVAPVTHRLPGTGADDIVAGVMALEREPAQVVALASRQDDWLAQRSVPALAERFSGIVQGLLGDRQLQAELGRMETTAPVPAAEPTASAPVRRQLLVDVSELYFRDARTGIQRVVRSVLAELLGSPPAGYAVCPVYATPGETYRYTAKFGGDAAAITDQAPIHVGPGDVFLGLDLSAHLFPEVETQLRNFRAAGASIHFVIYDLIPLRFPHYCDRPLTAAFEQWVHVLANEADGLHCISAAVADDVRAWLYQHADTLPLPEVSHFHLGADIDNSAPTTGLPADAEQVLAQLSGEGKTFLTVGTIEPRKGQIQTLDAFEMLWRQDLPLRLVLIGKAGWKMDAFIERLRAHPELGRRLFWLEGISDEYLEHVYRAADCLIAASETEGFGLPLIEAARRDLPILARDIPVFREVAGAHAWYFSGSQAADAALAVQTWLALERDGHAPASSGMPHLTWRQSAQELLRTVLPAAAAD